MLEELNREELTDRLRAANSLDEVLEVAGVTGDWDYLVVSDGSGMTWNTGCGWGSVLVDRHGQRIDFSGALNRGTNNMGELLGVIHPLLWISAQDCDPEGTQVVILTDSSYVADGGNGHNKRTANKELWALLDTFARKGLSLAFTRIPRDSAALNQVVDEIARTARLALQDVNRDALAELNKAGKVTADSVYDVNPSMEG